LLLLYVGVYKRAQDPDASGIYQFRVIHSDRIGGNPAFLPISFLEVSVPLSPSGISVTLVLSPAIVFR